MFLVLLSCTARIKYPDTHYYVQAEVDPVSASISANVQMVLVAGREYHDSILFRLNRGFEIYSLTAQELEHYVFDTLRPGILRLYIEEALMPGEQLHISLSYAGRISRETLESLVQDSDWLPRNPDTGNASFQCKMALPGGWKVISPVAGNGKHGKWLVQSSAPAGIPEILFSGPSNE